MLDPIQNQQNSASLLNQLNLQQIPKPLPLPSFPMQNLALIPSTEDQLFQGMMAQNNRISLTPQSFANIITNSIIKVVESMMSIFMEKLQSLFGQAGATGAIDPASSSSVAGSAGPAGTVGAEAVGGTAGANEPAATTGAGAGATAGVQEQKPSFFDGVKDVFGKVSDFFFGGSGGFLDFAKDVLTSVIPGLGALSIPKLMQKFKTLGKGLKTLLRGGKDALDGLLSKGKDFLSGAVDAGKKFFKKLF